MPPETRRANTPVERLSKVIEHPSENVERNIGRIERQMGAFQASAEADIAKLLQFDHQDIKNTVIDKGYQESIHNIEKNYNVLKSLIEMLQSAPESEKSLSTIASLETLLQAVEDSLVGHDYRKKHSLPSAETQVEKYITSIANLKDEDTISEEDTERLTSQPDILDMYYLGAQERISAKNITGEGTSVSEVLDYADQLGETADPATWTEQNCLFVLDVIRATQKLQELALFKNQAESRLVKLTEQLQLKIEAYSGLDLVVPLIYQAKELPLSTGDEIDDLATVLDEVIFLDPTGENNGWIEVDEAACKDALNKAHAGKKKFEPKGWSYNLKSAEVKKLIQKKHDFCATAETFLTQLLDSKDQRTRLKPIIQELRLTTSYIRAERMAKTQSEPDEILAQAA